MASLIERTFPHQAGRAHARILGGAVAVGVIGGVAAVIFEASMDAVSRLVLGTADPALGGISPLRSLVAPALAGLVAGLLTTYATTTGRPQGIADAIGHVRGAGVELPPQNMLASAAAALMTIGGGQSAGREGPIVQVAVASASFAGRLVGLTGATARVLAAAAAAGAIGASFNSPLGGAFFALEVLLGSFALEAFAPVVVASVAGTLVGQVLLGDRLALRLPESHLGGAAEILLFPILGLGCGLVTVAFRGLVSLCNQQFARVGAPPWAQPVVAAGFVGVLAAAGLPDAMGNGYARLEVLVGAEHPGLGFLALVLAAKLVGTALSVAGRSGGGMFAPSLFLGAVSGLIGADLIGRALPVQPDAGTFAIVGMAAVAASLAHAPVTMVIMIAEMTGNYAIILPGLVAVAIASLVSRAAFRQSLYIQSLLDRGVDLDRGHEELVVHGLSVGDLMVESGFVTVSADAGFKEIADHFLTRRVDQVLVLGPERRLVGAIALHDVKRLLVDPSAGEGVVASGLAVVVPTVTAATSVGDAMELLFRGGIATLPVVDAGGHLVGVVSERDVVGTLRREILGGDVGLVRFDSGPADARQTDFFELPGGYGLRALSAAPFAGTAVGDLAARTGLVVLAVDRWRDEDGRATRVPPAPELVLGERDGVVVLGPNERLTAHQGEVARPS